MVLREKRHGDNLGSTNGLMQLGFACPTTQHLRRFSHLLTALPAGVVDVIDEITSGTMSDRRIDQLCKADCGAQDRSHSSRRDVLSSTSHYH